jgi:hypothetical protein
MRCHMITTYAQNLGIEFFQLLVLPPERHRLLCSTTGKIKHVKRQNNVFLAMKLAQTDVSVY